MLPLYTVESPAFKKLIGGISSVQVAERKSFTLRLDKAFDEMEKKVKTTLKGIDSVSTTADIWTAHNRNYFRMTMHWINPDSLKCCKAAICCARITGRHTYDVLAAKIEHIHSIYGLNGKVTATVTNNGSNFVKAFASFSLPAVDHTSTSSDTSVSPNPSMEEDNPDLDEGKTTFENVCDF